MANYTEYPIKQINSADVSNNKDVLRQIIAVTANPFSGKLPIEVFLETEMQVALGSKEPWHQFYIVDPSKPKLTIISSFRIMYKRGNHDNFVLLIGNVHTNPEYRNRGFVRYMISQVIQKYELLGHKFAAPESDDADVEAYFSRNLHLDMYKYYWTLYSGVPGLYEKFGFQSVREMNWLIYEEPVADKTAPPMCDLEPYSDNGTEVTFLTTESDLTNVNQYFSDPAYASYVNSEAPSSSLIRSTSLEYPMIHSFYIRDAVASRYYGRKYKYIGVKISHPHTGTETFAIVCGAIDYSGILIQKLFTNLQAKNDSERHLLAQDLAYVVKFLRHVNVMDYALLSRDFNGSIKLLITTHDICTKDETTHGFVMETLQKDWQLDTSHDVFLPMMKEWAQPGISEGVKWINNGFWCFG
jgi:hypothetical protein